LRQLIEKAADGLLNRVVRRISAHAENHPPFVKKCYCKRDPADNTLLWWKNVCYSAGDCTGCGPSSELC
jgi:hypothetical protein